eukprot:scaffold3348_cov194-Chaetoceros_neogracile.AAC.4
MDEGNRFNLGIQNQTVSKYLVGKLKARLCVRGDQQIDLLPSSYRGGRLCGHAKRMADTYRSN